MPLQPRRKLLGGANRMLMSTLGAKKSRLGVRAVHLMAIILALKPSYGQTLRRPRTCSLENNTPKGVICHKVPRVPQTCELSSEMEEQQQLHTVDDTFEWFRNCDCGNLTYTDYYCPMVADVCHVPRWRSYQPTPRPPICIRQESRRVAFSKNIWPVLIVCMACMFACLLCSRGGHQSISFVTSAIAPWLRTAYATYLLRRRPHQASFLIRRWVRRREERFVARYAEIMNGTADTTTNLSNAEETLLRDAINHNLQGRPHMLKLKTKTFHESERDGTQKSKLSANPSHNEQEETKMDEVTETNDEDDVDEDFDGCMICFGPLCEGDRVGSLRCDHVFHAECLKTWLRRRNVCPLCLCENAADVVKHEISALEESA